MHVRDLFHAIRRADSREVRDLLRRGATLDAVDRRGRTLLMRAVLAGDLEVVRSLLEGGVDCSAADPEGWTALHYAAQERRADVAALLLDHGARLEAADAYGNTPLWRAVFAAGPRPDAVALLRRRGANPAQPNRSGISPLDLVRDAARPELARLFPELAPLPAAVGARESADDAR